MDPVEIIGLVARLIKEIAELAKRGVSDEDIKNRIFAPGEVGSKLIEAVRSRDKAGRDFLGR